MPSVFQMKTQPEYVERNELFLNGNFVCIGYSEVGSMASLDKEAIKQLLKEQYGWESHQLGNHLGIVNAFVNTMQEDDKLLIADYDWVYIGRIASGYYYKEDAKDEGMCHRRDIEWLGKAQRHQFNEKVKELLRNRSIITKFPHPYDIAELEKVLGQTSISQLEQIIDEDVKTQAVNVLVKSLNSDNEAIRVQAALGLMQLFK